LLTLFFSLGGNFDEVTHPLLPHPPEPRKNWVSLSSPEGLRVLPFWGCSSLSKRSRTPPVLGDVFLFSSSVFPSLAGPASRRPPLRLYGFCRVLSLLCPAAFLGTER